MKLWVAGMFLLMLSLAPRAGAQTWVTVVGSDNVNSSTVPIYTWYTEYPYTQQLYLASELTAAMAGKPITHISFKYYGLPKLGVWMDIYMVQVPAGTDDLSGGYYTTGLRRVAQSKWVEFRNPSGTDDGVWVDIELDEPFYWDGTSNLAVSIQQLSLSERLDCYFKCHTKTGMSRTSLNEDATVPLRLTNVPQDTAANVTTVLRNQRPHIRFGYGSCTANAATFAFSETVCEVDPGAPFTSPTLTGPAAGDVVYYTSSNPYVASVNMTTGMVSLTGQVGVATITAEWRRTGRCAKFTSYTINVKDNCITVGSETIGNNMPFNTMHGYTWSQMIYKGTEINESNRIHSISFEAVADNTTTRAVKVYLGRTSKEKFDDDTDFIPQSELTLVYEGNLNIHTGWNRFEFNRVVSFDYDMSDNLVVAVATDLVDASGFLSNTNFYKTNTTENTCIAAYTDAWRDIPEPSYYDGHWDEYPTTDDLHWRVVHNRRPNIDICTYNCRLRDGEFKYDATEAGYAVGDVFNAPVLTNTTGGVPVFSSSDETVAQVASDGTVTMQGTTGEVIITATIAAADSYCANNAQYIIRAREYRTLTYNTSANCTGTASAAPESQTGLGTVTIHSDVPACSGDGQVFTKWNTEPDGTGDDYYPGGSFPLLHDATLYAIYSSPCCITDSALVVTYVRNGGERDTLRRSPDGYYNFDICQHETLTVKVESKEGSGCTMSSPKYLFQYANLYQPREVSGTEFTPPSPYTATFDSVIGYDLVFSATGTGGCRLEMPGRIRVSNGIKVEKVSDDPFVVCPGMPADISVGYLKNGVDYVQVDRAHPETRAVKGHTDTIFLPDGLDCGDGCSYISSVEFYEFNDGATIRSNNDISYLKLNLEHSYIGDLNIQLVCPDGKYANILKLRNKESGSCLNEISSSNVGWPSSAQGGMSYYSDRPANAQFGMTREVYNEGNSTPTDAVACDKENSLNMSGIGWDYIWSCADPDESGYTYASSTGTNKSKYKQRAKVYYKENMTVTTNEWAYATSTSSSHSVRIVNPSVASTMSNIYVPDDEFKTALEGCPFNGEWSIRIQDGYKCDNGWLFSWELALNQDSLRDVWGYNAELDSTWMECHWNGTKYNDHITVTPPPGFTTGAVDCNIITVDNFGCQRDTTHALNFEVRELILSVSDSLADCDGENGRILVTVPDEYSDHAPFTFWLDPVFSPAGSIDPADMVSSAAGPITTGKFRDMDYGHHTVYVVDNSGCPRLENIDLAINEITGTVTEQHDAVCNGAADGSFTVKASTTQPIAGNEFTYTVAGLGSQSSASDDGVTFSGLPAGDYEVVITDRFNSCEDTVTVTIGTTMPPITLLGNTLVQPMTTGCPLLEGNYTISADVNGTGPYSYQWLSSHTIIPGEVTGTHVTATIASDGSCGTYYDTLIVTETVHGCVDTFASSFVTVTTTPSLSVAAGVVRDKDWGCDELNERFTPDWNSFEVTDACNSSAKASVTPSSVTEDGCHRSKYWVASYTNSCGDAASNDTIFHSWLETGKPVFGAMPVVTAVAKGSECKYTMPDLTDTVLSRTTGCESGGLRVLSQTPASLDEYLQSNLKNDTIDVVVVVRDTCGDTAHAHVQVVIPQNQLTLLTNFSTTTTVIDTSACNGATVSTWLTVSNPSGTAHSVWSSSPAGFSATDPSYPIELGPDTNYHVVVGDDNGCTAEADVNIAINPDPVLTALSGYDHLEQSICEGKKIDTIKVELQNSVYDGGSTIGTAAGITVAVHHHDAAPDTVIITGTPTATGSYSLTALSNQSPACDPKSLDIIFNITDTIVPEIVAGVGGTERDTVCVTSPVSLTDTVMTIRETAGVDGDTWSWTVDGGTIMGGADTREITVKWTSAGDKTVAVTVSHGTLGCTSVKSKTIHVQAVPTVDMGSAAGGGDEITICPNRDTMSFYADLAGADGEALYTYTFGGDLTFVQQALDSRDTATAIPTDCGADYRVGVTVTDNHGCSASDSMTVHAIDNTPPTVTVSGGGTAMDEVDIDGCSSDLETLYPAVATPADLHALNVDIADGCTPFESLAVSHRDSVFDDATCGYKVRRYYLVSDLCGNKDSVYQDINIHIPAHSFTISSVATSTDVNCESAVLDLHNNSSQIQLPEVKDGCGHTLVVLDSFPTPVMTGRTCMDTTVFTFEYKDCEGHDTSWSFTYNVTLPRLGLSDTTRLYDTLPCVSSAHGSDYNAPSNLTLTDACGRTVTAQPADELFQTTASSEPIDDVDIDGTGTVTYNWVYEDCSGRRYVWQRIHVLDPGEFSAYPNDTLTVSCSSQIVTPPVPVREVCGEPVVFVPPFSDPDTNFTVDASIGCYVVSYSIGYTVFGNHYTYIYSYAFNPPDFTIPADDVVITTVHCIGDTAAPTPDMLPVVTHNYSSGDIGCAAGIDDTIHATGPDRTVSSNGCLDTVVYTYHYSDCRQTKDWHYTYIIAPHDAPHEVENGEHHFAATSDHVECFDNAVAITGSDNLPIIVSECGDTLAAPVPTYADTLSAPDALTGTRTWHYVYSDCAGNEYDWTFVYTVERTTAPVEQPADPLDPTSTVDTVSHVTCIDEVVRPLLPTVVDVCGNIVLPAADSSVVRTANNCQDTVTYYYNYYDPSDDALVFNWYFRYYIDRTAMPTIVEDVSPNYDEVECFAQAGLPTALPVVVDACGDTLVPFDTVVVEHHDMDGLAELCTGYKEYTFRYRDCTGSNYLDWTYTRNVVHPVLAVPANDTVAYNCVNAAMDYVPQPDTLYNACGDMIVPDSIERVTSLNAHDSGYVSYHYTYSDCDGLVHDWYYVCDVRPGEFVPPVDSTRTTNCLAQATVPTAAQLPVIDVCGLRIPQDQPWDSGEWPDTTYSVDFNDTCGTVTYTYHYTVHGQSYTWSYIYTIEPPEFTLPTDVATSDIIECFDANQPDLLPTLPVVVNACGDTIGTASNPPVLVIDSSDYVNNGRCHGNIVYNYTYSDCGGNSIVWQFTHVVHHSTLPHIEGVEPDTAGVVACFGDAVETFAIPTVVDVCGRVIDRPTAEVTEGGSDCEGWRNYKYIFVDCDGVAFEWNYRYTVHDTVPPHIDLDALVALNVANAQAMGNCQYAMPDLSGATLQVSSDMAGENCSGTVTFDSQTPPSSQLFEQPMTDSTVTVRLVVSDACGNRDTAFIDIVIPGSQITVDAVSVDDQNQTAQTGVICAGQSIRLQGNASSTNGEGGYNWTPTTGLDAMTGNQAVASPGQTTTYTVDFTDGNGCSATDVITITVNQLTSTGFAEVVCDRYTWNNHGTTYANLTQSDTYYNSYLTAEGCPSVDTLFLTVNYNSSTNYVVDNACDRYEWNGMTYAVDGIFTSQVYYTEAGCPSVDTLTLTLLHNSSTGYSDEACDSYTWLRGNQTFTENGTYFYSYNNDAGCPSVDTLYLTVHHSSVTNLSATACDHYEWYGQTFGETTTAEHTLSDQYGCDSLLRIDIVIHYSDSYQYADTICAGETYSFFNQTLTESGTFEHVIPTVHGCDSTISLYLLVVPRPPVTIGYVYDCKRGNYTLTANTTATYFQWRSMPNVEALGSQATERSVTVSPIHHTVFTVLAGYEGLMQCAVQDTLSLEPLAVVDAKMDYSPIAVYREQLDWSAVNRTGKASWHQWYVNDLFYGDDDEITGTANVEDDSVVVVLIAGTEQCTDTSRVVIPMLREGLYVPNVFTPDLKINRKFGAVGTGVISFTMDIFNRSGAHVFHAEDIDDWWDGSHNGIPCINGSYVYRIVYNTEVYPDVKNEVVGQVILIR